MTTTEWCNFFISTHTPEGRESKLLHHYPKYEKQDVLLVDSTVMQYRKSRAKTTPKWFCWTSFHRVCLRCKLLRKWWKHAQISKIFNVVIASALCRIARHRQHVLEDFSLTGLLVRMLVTALLIMMLALPLGPDLRRSPLELSTALATLSKPCTSVC